MCYSIFGCLFTTWIVINWKSYHKKKGWGTKASHTHTDFTCLASGLNKINLIDSSIQTKQWIFRQLLHLQLSQYPNSDCFWLDAVTVKLIVFHQLLRFLNQLCMTNFTLNLNLTSNPKHQSKSLTYLKP